MDKTEQYFTDLINNKMNDVLDELADSNPEPAIINGRLILNAPLDQAVYSMRGSNDNKFSHSIESKAKELSNDEYTGTTYMPIGNFNESPIGVRVRLSYYDENSFHIDDDGNIDNDGYYYKDVDVYFSDGVNHKIDTIAKNIRNEYGYLQPYVKEYSTKLHNHKVHKSNLEFREKDDNKDIDSFYEIKEYEKKIEQDREYFRKEGIDIDKVTAESGIKQYALIADMAKQKLGEKIKNESFQVKTSYAEKLVQIDGLSDAEKQYHKESSYSLNKEQLAEQSKILTEAMQQDKNDFDTNCKVVGSPAWHQDIKTLDNFLNSHKNGFFVRVDEEKGLSAGVSGEDLRQYVKQHDIHARTEGELSDKVAHAIRENYQNRHNNKVENTNENRTTKSDARAMFGNGEILQSGPKQNMKM